MKHYITFLGRYFGSANLVSSLILLINDDHAVLEDDVSGGDHSFKVIFPDVWKPLSLITEVLVNLPRMFGCGVCEHLVWITIASFRFQEYLEFIGKTGAEWTSEPLLKSLLFCTGSVSIT
jgi:hypothetical protein